MKVKIAGKLYNVVEIKKSLGITHYCIEDEPNHYDWVNNVEIIEENDNQHSSFERIMTREEIFGSDVQWIENWVQRVESLTGLKCSCIREVWDRPSFTKKELKEAQREEAQILKSMANDLIRLC